MRRHANRVLSFREHYLYLYSNRVVRPNEDPKMQLSTICCKVIDFCPHYRVWKRVLALCSSFVEKDRVSSDLINAIINNTLVDNENRVVSSHRLLEVLLFKVRL